MVYKIFLTVFVSLTLFADVHLNSSLSNFNLGNDQLSISINSNGKLRKVLSHGESLNQYNKLGPLFSVTLLENVYGLKDGKRRTVELKHASYNQGEITVAPAKGELPSFTFKTIDKGDYFILKLISMKNLESENATVLTMRKLAHTSWMPLDSVTKKSSRFKDDPKFFGVLQRSDDLPLGSIAMWASKEGLEEDEVLYKVWANEDMPHPNVDGEWTVERAKQWIADYIELVCKKHTSEMIIGPRKPEDLKEISQVANKFGISKLYMHLNSWGGRYWANDRDNLEVNHDIFPGGRKDMEAFGQLLKNKDMQLTLRSISYALGGKHPEYLGETPDAQLATWWKGKLAADISSQATEIIVTETNEQRTEFDTNYRWDNIFNRKCIQIGNELITFKSFVDNGDKTWTLKGCKRGFGNSLATHHQADVPARGLYRIYGIAFAPDPDSDLMKEMAKNFGEFHNDINAGIVNFDALEVHEMMYNYGDTKFMGEVYKHIKTPMHGSTSGPELTWGFIEGMFNSVKMAEDPWRATRPKGIPYAVDMKLGLHQSHWSASSPYAYVWAIPANAAAGRQLAVSAQAGFHDVTTEIINQHGLMDHYAKLFKQWSKYGTQLPAHIRERIFKSWYKNPWEARYSLIDELFRFEGEGSFLSVVPFRMLKGENDRGWTYHQEHGTIYPYQYLRPGQSMKVANPYEKQSPEFIIRVMPDFKRNVDFARNQSKGESEQDKKFNDMLDKFQGASGVVIEEQKVNNDTNTKITYRIMPNLNEKNPKNKIRVKGPVTFAEEGNGLRISCSNDSDEEFNQVNSKNDSLSWYPVKSDITKAGGLGLIVDGDGSGSILVIRTKGQGSRDYIVHLDFKGKRYIEIPSPQASWVDARWSFTNAYKRWRGNSITSIAIGFNKVEAKSKTSVLIEDMRFLPEKESVLKDATIEIGGGKMTILGEVESGHYLWYKGGDSVGVYDLNWNKLKELPIKNNSCQASNGDNEIKIINNNEGNNPWLEVQFFVKDKAMLINDKLSQVK